MHAHRRSTAALLPALLLAAGFSAPAAAGSELEPEPRADAQPSGLRADERYGRLPMAFEPNLGQTDPRVRFLARGHGYTAFVTADEVVLSLAAASPAPDARHRPADAATADEPAPSACALRLSLPGAREPHVSASRELEGRSNYLVGDDESTWLRDVPTYAEVRWSGAYDGVDAVFYGTQQQLEYDFVVAPGADLSQVRVRFEGQQSAEVDEAGELVLRMTGGEVRQLLPLAFQEDGSGRRRVSARCVLTGDGEVGFEVGDYDPSRPLVVDPALVFATYLGGVADQQASGIAVDASGAAYVIGHTSATSFPTTSTAFDEIQGGGQFDTFVTKFTADGASLAYSTYLGGRGGDFGSGIAVDASGAAYAVGSTESSDFPTTSGAFDRSFGGFFDVFVTKLAPDGATLAYSTFIGGTSVDNGLGIAVDAAGAAYMTGDTGSTDFPTTAGVFDSSNNGGGDAFVTKLSAAGTSLVYSTYLGSAGDDEASGIAVDAAGAAYVAGFTNSAAFPTTSGAFDTSFNGGQYDAFATKVAAAGNALVYSSYLGGGAGLEFGNGIAVDAAGAAYVVGYTESSNFPTTTSAVDRTLGGTADAFVTKFSASGASLTYSTYLGGGSVEEAYAVDLDASGAACVVGFTLSTNFPTTPGAFDTTTTNGVVNDAFVTKLAPAGNALAYSTFLGGDGGTEIAYAVAVDASGAAYIAGYTASGAFPTTAGAFDTFFSGSRGDAFVTKLSAAGSALAYSSYLGDESFEIARAIAVDTVGLAYVAGDAGSTDFPTVAGSFDPAYNGGITDAFVAKLNGTGTALVYATYVGGGDSETADAVAVDSSGAVYLTGHTQSVNFPGAN
jgi:hypothetical protein